ncbi:MAG TPA: hypothetical protein VGG33_03910 [Polyangia bacterium]
MMSAAGWIFMLGSVSAVVVLTFWCFWKVLTVPTDHGESTIKPPPAGT